jgi:hypothetical protein
MPILLKTALRYLLKSLLIPWIIKNLDKWTTVLNKKIIKLLENTNDQT